MKFGEFINDVDTCILKFMELFLYGTYSFMVAATPFPTLPI
jgi:hypothetical protein